MGVRTVLAELVPEKSTVRYTGTLKDEASVVIPSAALTTLTLTLYALDAALTVINLVSAVDILNTGRGTVGATDGKLTITLLPADGVLVDATLTEEPHLMLIEWTYASGAKAGKHEVQFVVRNFAKVA